MVTTRITLPADDHQIDATGLVWALLDKADTPDRITIGSVVVTADSDDPFLDRVVEIVPGRSGCEIVHLEVMGVPDLVPDELRAADLPRA